MKQKSVTDVDTHIGHRLRELRSQAGVSQIKLGKLLGVSFQQIQKYENGSNRLSAARLWKIAQEFGIKIEAFFP